jgi:tryptophanyl-tRNA synthetase
MKKQLAEDIIKIIAPIRERIHQIKSDNGISEKGARMGAEKGRESASKPWPK